MNETSKAFIFNPNGSAQKLREMVVERLGLQEHNFFNLFVKSDKIERCISPDENPYEVVKTFENSHKKGNKKCFLLFKKQIFVSDSTDIEKELKDPVALDLIYQQAVSDIIMSIQPCSKSDVIRLAGLQMQVVYGNYNPNIHKDNFLLKNPQNNLKSFFPEAIYFSKTPHDLEKLILKKYALLPEIKTIEQAKLNYINLVRTLPYYGTTFFSCRSTEKSIQGKVNIGINYGGIVLLKPKTNELILEFLFTEICSWNHSSTTFEFEFGNQSETQTYHFETKQGKAISSTIQTYIDIHIQKLRYEDNDNDNDTTYEIIN
jgi:hypothetical protein